jgi:hypothetical protein
MKEQMHDQGDQFFALILRKEVPHAYELDFLEKRAAKSGNVYVFVVASETSAADARSAERQHVLILGLAGFEATDHDTDPTARTLDDIIDIAAAHYGATSALEERLPGIKHGFAEDLAKITSLGEDAVRTENERHDALQSQLRAREFKGDYDDSLYSQCE